MIEKTPCGNCGSTDYRTWKMWHEGKPEARIRYERCDRCASIKPEYPRDAMGNKVVVSDDAMGKYSFAIDAPITSRKQFSEHLRKNGLAQKG